jgi:hypothetical protein
MISPSVLSAASQIREAFQTARPFKHACIDHFLVPDVAEHALADFPVFDRKNAINEFGEVGGKAVNTNLREISAFYDGFYKWIFSEEFLGQMSELTGIPDLIGDPALYGGGTHENLHGQELDPHVDFNFVSGGGAHRRVNLLIYLNKNWDPSWGGALEIHSNPRDTESNEIKSYDMVFNRAIVFETNEYSWHGFPRINLPVAERTKNSRKCLSIYLYTRTRPAEEIAGTHGTFYVQRPLDPVLKPGYALTSADIQELRKGYRNRDRSIEAYQKMEERLGRELNSLHRYLDEIVASIRLPVVGFALQTRRISGAVWHDGWAGPAFAFEMKAVADITAVEMHGAVPNADGNEDIKVVMTVAGTPSTAATFSGTNFVVQSTVSISQGAVFLIEVTCSRSVNLRKEGKGEDDRDLSFLLSMIRFS